MLRNTLNFSLTFFKIYLYIVLNYKTLNLLGFITQLVEYSSDKREVGGSNPPKPNILN